MLVLKSMKSKICSNKSLISISSTSGILNKNTNIKFIRDGTCENNEDIPKDHIDKEESCSIKSRKVSFIEPIVENSHLDESKVNTKIYYRDLKISNEAEISCLKILIFTIIFHHSF